MGASQDGSYIYFVAKGVLAHNALGVEPGYHVYVHHNGTTTYIATLSPTEEEWEILIRENCSERRRFAEWPLCGVRVGTESDRV